MTKKMTGIEFSIQPLTRHSEARTCAPLMVSTEPWITLKRTYKGALSVLTDPAREVYLAKAKKEIIGFIVLHMHGTFSGYIQTIAIKPEWRGQSIGSKLIAFAEKRIFKEKPNAFMCVSSFNKKAQKLYRRLGYKRVGELKDFVVTGHSEFLLRKTIGPLAEYAAKSGAKVRKSSA